MTNQDIIKNFQLSTKQTEILYNFEKLKVEADIKIEKDDKVKSLKINWLLDWEAGISDFFKRISLQSPEINWYTDVSELNKQIEAEFSGEPNSIWYDLVLLEVVLFVPYYPLNVEKEEIKKFKKVNYKKSEWLDFIVYSQKHSDSDLLKRYKKTYKKSISRMKGTKEKIIISLLVTSLITALTAGTATFFAPAIAASLFGSEFTGLYGVALTNATLAYIGGGAIVTGGAGILGGQSIIAGGGAILGLAGGGLTTSAVTISKLLTTPEENLIQTAKIEVVIREILANKRKDITLAEKTLNSIQESINSLNFRLNVLNIKEAKQEIKNSEKSIKQMNKAQTELRKFVSSFKIGLSRENEE